MEKQKHTEKTPPLPHSLVLQDRTGLSLTGVVRVVHCEPESAALETSQGLLLLSGAELSVTALDLAAGEAKLSGRLDALEYTQSHTPGGWLRRLTR